MALSKVLAERLFTHETLVHAISGAAGATVAMSLFYPLDTIRSRLQVEEGRESKSIVEMLRDIMESEGFEGIYRGLSPVLQSLWCSNFVYFYSFHGLRAVFSTDRGHSAGRDLMLATIAGVINVIVTTPMWVVNTRMKMQGAIAQYGPHDQENQSANYKFRSLLDGLITIYREEGVHALWSSTLPSLILVSNPSIQFMVYEALKRRCETLGIALSAGTAFSLGAISKCIATVLTYPLQCRGLLAEVIIRERYLSTLQQMALFIYQLLYRTAWEDRRDRYFMGNRLHAVRLVAIQVLLYR
ncbi:peroxisomal membrane protein PMP34-like isoform X2 [Varroa jacobsoni]|uniref:peroxisomal membrane protein PMP34-like isoform X2 n=1 Tax=Varroa jacobsoni TaxID=62625 RepID=UPI000BF67C3F|nr:peroxisomal membrane protein PMP34-like isoform X2 [Varroa jacobsoni]